MNILVLSTVDLFGFQLMTCLGEAGHRVHLFSDTRWAMASRLSRHCHKHLYQPRELLAGTSDELIELVNAYCELHKIDLVVPADMRCTIALAHVRTRIAPASVAFGPDPDTIEKLHNKWRFSEFLKAQDLPHPDTLLLNDASELAQQNIEYPVIVKPPAGENGEGIQRIDSENALRAYLDDTTEGSRLPCLVQRFIDGKDIDISLLADHGKLLAWTIQQRNEHQPGTICFFEHPEVYRIAKHIVEAANYTGVAHLDMRIDRRTGYVYTIELNPRFWGSLLWSFWAGVNFADHLVRLTLGLELQGPITAHAGPCTHSGLAPTKLAQALIHGRLVPDDLSIASAKAWRTNHADPLPQFYHKLADYLTRRAG